MWMLENETPYAAERNWFMDKNAAKSWLVAVKATFDIFPDGTTGLSGKQESPLYAEQYRGEPGNSSVLYEADLAGPKAATDVLLNGHAYAPGGEPVTHLTVSMTVDGLTKKLTVFGDRRWERDVLGDVAMTPPQPFEKVPLTYETAFGGWDTAADDPAEHRLEPRNPVGTGFATRRQHLFGKAAPNVEDPANLISAWDDRPRPAGFGVISSYWLPRRNYAGTYDDAWIKERFPLWATDFDDRFFQHAPEDQQIAGHLRGGETVELLNVTPFGPLRFALPKIHPVFTTYFRGTRIEHRAKIQTVVIEPDHPRVIMVWQTTLPVQQHADNLDVTVIREKPFV